MKAKLAKEYIPRLLDYAITYHARRGIRWWCDCSFCVAKKLGTAQIGTFRFVSPNATSYSNKYPWKMKDPDGERWLGGPISKPYAMHNDDEWRRGDSWEHEDYLRRVVDSTREEGRRKLRAILAEEKERVF